MGEAFITRRGGTGGGGSGDVYAFLIVSYPAGSTCTASNGTTTLTAPDTSGNWVCKVPNAGTWPVSCTNGTDTASTAVTITTEGQREEVALSYTIYLIQSGDLILTPEYVHASLTSTGDYVQFKAAGSYYCAAIFGPVNFTGKSNLTIEIGPNSKSWTDNNALMCPGIGTSKSKPDLKQGTGVMDPNSEYKKLPNVYSSTGATINTGQHTLPVTANGNQYVWVEWAGQTDRPHSIYIANFFLS
jgi:hypothetical protein